MLKPLKLPFSFHKYVVSHFFFTNKNCFTLYICCAIIEKFHNHFSTYTHPRHNPLCIPFLLVLFIIYHSFTYTASHTVRLHITFTEIPHSDSYVTSCTPYILLQLLVYTYIRIWLYSYRFFFTQLFKYTSYLVKKRM